MSEEFIVVIVFLAIAILPFVAWWLGEKWIRYLADDTMGNYCNSCLLGAGDEIEYLKSQIKTPSKDLKFELDNLKWRLCTIEKYINKDGGAK